MKNLKKRNLTTAIIVLSIIVLTGVGIGVVGAHGDGSYSSIVDKIAEKFNLNKEEVEEVFEEHREEKHQEMQSKLEEKLNKAVEDGKISEEQKQAIIVKKEEMRGKYEELKDLSLEERHEAMEEFKEEMNVWAEENDIDLKQFFGHKKERYEKGHFGKGFDG